MEKTKQKLMLRMTILLVALSLFTTSIVFAETFTSLKKDTLPKSKATSVIFGRVRMISQFKDFDKSGGKNYVFKGTRNEDQKVCNMTVSIKSLSEKWKGDNGLWGYDSFFTIAAEPGEYSFNTVTYSFDNFNLSNLSASIQGYINQLTLPFQKEHSVEDGTLIYFGVINIYFRSFTVEEGPRFSYKYYLEVTDELDTDLEKFKTNYPKLYEQFKDNIVTADFVGANE